MWYEALADAVVAVHLGFVLFVVIGGLAVLRWEYLAWVHIPAVVWGALVEFVGWPCPLTPIENALRAMGGADGYQTGFIEYYVLPLLYPAMLTRELQLVLGALVVTFNLVIYAWMFSGKRGDADSVCRQ